MHRLRLILILTVAASALFLGEREVPQARATFPGENGKIAFSLCPSPGTPQLTCHITVMDANGSNVRPLTSGSVVDASPDWSPDGKKIAFSRFTQQAGRQIFVMDANGNNLKSLTNLTFNPSKPKWSPDGSRILFFTDLKLKVMDSNGSDISDLDIGGLDIAFKPGISASWSPDGKSIAFTAGDLDAEDQHDVVAILDLEQNNIRRVFDAPQNTATSGPDWSPDGSRLTFSHGGGSVHIFTAGVDGGAVNETDVAGFGPVWSPDGKKILFSRILSGDAGLRFATINPDGSGQADLVNLASSIGGGAVWQRKPQDLVESVEFTQAIQQLQTLDELKADLAGDGKPPVPMIAGKPAAMRVYFKEVEAEAEYTVKVSGLIDKELVATLQPGCTPGDRRKGVNNCKSADFYFTPPQGNWSIGLVVKDSSGKVVVNETFNLSSVKTDDITLKAVSVCDTHTSPDAAWGCQDAFPLIQYASLLRRMFPTANVKVIVTGQAVRRRVVDYSDPLQWWGQVDRDLDALHTDADKVFAQLGTEIYYVGMVRNGVPGGTGGAAYIDTRGAASRASELAPFLVAHEVGHDMGLDHTDTGVPAFAGGSGCTKGTRTTLPDYPYADNRIRSGAAPGVIEVGFDVATGTPLNGEFFFDVMGYCWATAPPAAPDITAWITPFSTLELIAPNGPLGIGPAQPMAQPASGAGDFWLLQGSLDAVSQNATLAPLVTVQGDGPTGSGAGTHRIEVHGDGGLLFARMFTPRHGHASPSPGSLVESTGSAFAELIPVPPGATSILIFDAMQNQIGAITLEGAAPVVDEIALPASFSGVQGVSWSVSDADSTEHTYWVDYSSDGGQTWLNQAQGLTDDFLKLDFDLLPEADGQGAFRVIASDGVNSGEAVSASFSVTGKAPRGEIIGPYETSFHDTDLVWLEAAAWDADDWTLDGGAVTWSSNRDGALGSGASLPVYDLSVGAHTITMTARDSDNNTVTDTISVTVTGGPIVEGGTDRTWGDVKCDGNVNLGDSIALARTLVSLDPGQGAGCPAMGAAVTVGSAERTWGDVDCSGALGLGDAIAIARFLVGLLPNAPGCPVLGTTVTVQT